MLARIVARHRRASAELFGMLLLAAVAVAALTAWHADERARQVALDRATTGVVFASWLKATHRHAQENDLSPLLAAGGGVLTPAALAASGAAPQGLPTAFRAATMRLGVIPDANGVGLAFAVLEPDQDHAIPGIRAGIVEAGLTLIGETGHESASPPRHLTRIETVLGGPLATGSLVVTADTLPLNTDQLYRRPQPGRPWLNALATDVDLETHDIRRGGAIGGIEAETSGTARIAGEANVNGEAQAAGVEADELEAAHVEAARTLAVTAGLTVGTLRSGALAAASATMTGHLESRNLATTTLAAQDVAVAAAASVTTAIDAGRTTFGTLSGSPRLTTASISAAGGVYGPSLTVSGRLTAGSCDGC